MDSRIQEPVWPLWPGHCDSTRDRPSGNDAGEAGRYGNKGTSGFDRERSTPSTTQTPSRLQSRRSHRESNRTNAPHPLRAECAQTMPGHGFPGTTRWSRPARECSRRIPRDGPARFGKTRMAGRRCVDDGEHPRCCIECTPRSWLRRSSSAHAGRDTPGPSDGKKKGRATALRSNATSM
jgi:hypothetical protein